MIQNILVVHHIHDLYVLHKHCLFHANIVCTDTSLDQIPSFSLEYIFLQPTINHRMSDPLPLLSTLLTIESSAYFILLKLVSIYGAVVPLQTYHISNGCSLYRHVNLPPKLLSSQRFSRQPRPFCHVSYSILQRGTDTKNLFFFISDDGIHRGLNIRLPLPLVTHLHKWYHSRHFIRITNCHYRVAYDAVSHRMCFFLNQHDCFSTVAIVEVCKCTSNILM